ncbi:MAG: histidine kinase [Lachnospiraceae bacterium]|nr:histidine kinase [Lachnospiraceae bacterium]
MNLLKQNIKNIQLKNKIALIITLVVALTAIASLIGSEMLLHSSNKLLYQALAGSLNYSAEDISNKLTNIESMTNAIISNQSIKKGLISLMDEPYSQLSIQNVDNTITSSLVDYYQNYKNNDINYVNLYNQHFQSSSYQAKSSNTPDEIHNAVISAASLNSGYACWVTDYCNSYGLFLGRDSRRVQNLNFETMGTVVVNVDMDKLIRSSTQSILQDSEVQYIIFDNKKEIYHSKSLDTQYISYIDQKLKNNYDIISLGSDRFFCIRGMIENNHWEYICLVPYTYVDHTLIVTRIFSLLILISAVIIASVLSRTMIKSITKDFDRLVDKMKKFGTDESKLPVIDYDYDNRTDEIGVLHQQFDQMAVQIQKLIQQNYINEILTKDAKLKSLESQINPHFLYNALESVNWRAKALGAKDISDMVKSLGDLLRATLSNKNNNFTIAHELAIVNDYITIQKIRFEEERLVFQESIHKEILPVRIPQMTIQPLIDNAINYAMEVITETCYIHLTGFEKDHIVHILVTNNGSQFENDLLSKLQSGSIKPHGIGIGLLNIHQRIQLIYGSDYGLKLYNLDEEHAVAEIIIPEDTEDLL